MISFTLKTYPEPPRTTTFRYTFGDVGGPATAAQSFEAFQSFVQTSAPPELGSTLR